MKNKHIPVLTNEVIGLLNLANKSTYIDATLGSGGHTVALIEELNKKNCLDIEIITIDLDSKAWHYLQERLKNKAISFILNDKQLIIENNIKIRFAEINFSEIAKLQTTYPIKGIIADLGPSQNLLENTNLGLSYRKSENLDMRIDKNLQVTASDLLNALSKKQLNFLFRNYGDLKFSLSLAERIVDIRILKPITTTTQLNQIVKDVLVKIKVETDEKVLRYNLAKIYQALRIVVNLEYENLLNLLKGAIKLLDSKGELIVITFHSGEEKVISSFVKQEPKLKVKVSIISEKEVMRNNRARSAKLYEIIKPS